MALHRYWLVAVVIVLAGGLIGAGTAFAASEDEYVLNLSEAQLNVVEQNLVQALESNSPGLQASAAQIIRDVKKLRPEFKFSQSVIPLMGIVKNERSDIGARIVATLALHELKTARGDFAISRSAKFSNNGRIQHLCTWLTYARAKENGVNRSVVARGASQTSLDVLSLGSK